MKLLIEMDPTAHAPRKASPKEAGYDLCAHLPFHLEGMIIKPHSQDVVGTGIMIAIPENHYGQIAPRSGLALKNQIYIGAGVIDETYRGEIKVILFNHGDREFKISDGDRIAQLLIIPIASPEIEIVDRLPESTRGKNGFGSSGIGSDVVVVDSTKGNGFAELTQAIKDHQIFAP